MIKLAIFASGSGTNAQTIANFFKESKEIEIDCILSNNPNAYVLVRANQMGIYSYIFSRSDFYDSQKILQLLLDRKVNYIVLAGFLWLVPENLTGNYAGKMINIHPALLPKYGGKGMYGMKVHEAVVHNKDKESGITIHLVNNTYDDGDILFQARCRVEPTDTADEVAKKIHELEYLHFPRIIEKFVLGNL